MGDHDPPVSRRHDQLAQHLVRYEALFKLLDEIQAEEDIRRIAQRVARQWKYFANVASWRLVLSKSSGYLVIDGFRGDASLNDAPELQSWDERHWRLRRPCLMRTADAPPVAAPPHLSDAAIIEIQTLPIIRAGESVGLLSAAARHVAFSELDNKFIRLCANHFADRVATIVQRREAIEALTSRATHDPLTGALNRGGIMDRLENQLALSKRTGQALSAILADIDFFKVINDSYGHQVGDTVLCEIVRRLKASARGGDSTGRYGGEEFLFALYPCNADEARAVAERYRETIADTPFAIEGDPPRELKVTISLGVSSTEGRPGIGVQSLLKLADDALYQAKMQGRNCVRSAASPTTAPPTGASINGAYHRRQADPHDR